ncbi:hypothetical protein CEXT_407861 [Caerostris extrusa]|uniref:Maturase K n=1 Tax=Caerostris extrusa TaxID=172846 RepID=A0AAV4W4A0_CAEEX|nr:hypothetical protein CEXT_407861 [Caerostris extrusa]
MSSVSKWRDFFQIERLPYIIQNLQHFNALSEEPEDTSFKPQTPPSPPLHPFFKLSPLPLNPFHKVILFHSEKLCASDQSDEKV